MLPSAAPPLVAGATTFPPLGSVSLDSQSPKGSLRIQFPCHPSFAGGTMGAGQWRQSEFIAAAERKPYNRAAPVEKQANRPAGDGNAPLLPPPAASLQGKASHVIFRSLSLPYKSRSLATPEGEILALLCIEVLMSLKVEWRANFPLRGGKGTGFVGERSDLRIQ